MASLGMFQLTTSFTFVVSEAAASLRFDSSEAR